MTQPRGIRNNNPGNIDYNPRNQWDGQLGYEIGVPKPRFARFIEAKFGIRALAKLLLNYRNKEGMPGVGKPKIDTPLEFINRWAPSVENNTNAYASAVAKRLGVGVHDVIDITDPKTLKEVVIGIILHENGQNPYDDATVSEGIRLALGK
jgi:hypothetical protein